MKPPIRIGTRGSTLALWQASLIETKLKNNQIDCQLVAVESEGDKQQEIPLHEIGGVGLFTRMLDESLRTDEVDIAVHSLKDVPTELPEDIVQVAVLPRGNYQDVMVYKGDLSFIYRPDITATIATGSLRRKAQWLRKFPHHKVAGLRGNVQTRLRKLEESEWQGAVFARAGLERIALLPEKHIELDWMIPAPAQGTIVVTAYKENMQLAETVKSVLNDETTQLVTTIEREFMRTLEGGCTSPIGALAQLRGSEVIFKGGIFSVDGSREVIVEGNCDVNEKEPGSKWAREALAKGGKSVIEEIRTGQNIKS